MISLVQREVIDDYYVLNMNGREVAELKDLIDINGSWNT